MRERYTYEISTARDGYWRQVDFDDGMFSRDPASIVRALLENWVIEHPDTLSGGERIHITHPRRRSVSDVPDPDSGAAKVRVRIYRGARAGHQADPAGVGYLGHDARDFGAPSPAGESTAMERWQQVRGTVSTVVADKRVGAGAAAAAAMAAGLVARRLIKRRKH